MKRTVKVLLIFLVFILAIASSSLAEPLGFGFVNARDVALRGVMGGTIMDRLPKGTCVWIRDVRMDRAGKKWYEINAKAGVNEDGTEKEHTGWMRAEFIDAGDSLWREVESVAASDAGMLALRTDGTVEQAGQSGENAGQDLRGWAKVLSDIQQVGVCANGQACYAVGRDGTCYHSADDGENHTERIYTAGGKQRVWEITTDYQLKTGDSTLNWIYPENLGPEQLSHVTAVADNASRLLLLTDDGRVFAAGWQQDGEEEPEPDWEKWTDVVSLEAASCRFTEVAMRNPEERRDLRGRIVQSVLRHGSGAKHGPITEAARIAAAHSKGKDSAQVPVDYTRVKNVSKPSGALPGKVIYVNYNTIYVKP